MKKIKSKILQIILIFSIFVNIKGTAVVSLYGQCTCDQILLERECDLNSECQFENNKCQYIPCDQYEVDRCYQLKKCGRINGKCAPFKSCTSHNIKTEEECNKLHSNCYYDSLKQSCQDINEFNWGSCSNQLYSICLYGNEGLCILKNGKCQEMTSCSDAKATDLTCPLSFPACYPNKVTNECESINTCSKNTIERCLFAKEKVNSKKYLLCNLDKDLKACNDFDPSIQSEQTCAIKSFQYYHWQDEQCVRCNSNSFILTIFTIVILALNS